MVSVEADDCFRGLRQKQTPTHCASRADHVVRGTNAEAALGRLLDDKTLRKPGL